MSTFVTILLSVFILQCESNFKLVSSLSKCVIFLILEANWAELFGLFTYVSFTYTSQQEIEIIMIRYSNF